MHLILCRPHRQESVAISSDRETATTPLQWCLGSDGITGSCQVAIPGSRRDVGRNRRYWHWLDKCDSKRSMRLYTSTLFSSRELSPTASIIRNHQGLTLLFSSMS